MKELPVILSIKSPCSEDWHSMSEHSAGKYCNQCQKPVIDFTRKTDAAILKILQQHPGNICGRARTDQLDRALVTPVKCSVFIRISRSAAAIFLFMVNGLSTAIAQQRDSSLVIQHHISVKEKDVRIQSLPNAKPPSKLLQGKIISHYGNEIKDVKVLLSGSNLETRSDEHGLFEMAIPGDFFSDKIRLKLSCIEYESTEYVFEKRNLPASVTISMRSVAASLEGIEVGSICISVIHISDKARRARTLGPGSTINHPEYGIGEVMSSDEQGSFLIRFRNGSGGRSVRKLSWDEVSGSH